MAAVYKTLSSSAAQEKPSEGRRNRQRVLILVRKARFDKYQNQAYHRIELKRRNISTPTPAAGPCFFDVSALSPPSSVLLRANYNSRPHSRKEAKLDTKTKLYQLNELAGMCHLNGERIFAPFVLS